MVMLKYVGKHKPQGVYEVNEELAKKLVQFPDWIDLEKKEKVKEVTKKE